MGSRVCEPKTNHRDGRLLWWLWAVSFGARNDKVWSPAGILKRNPQVLSDDTKRRACESAEKHYGKHDRGVTEHWNSASKSGYDQDRAGNNRECHTEDTRKHEQPERQVGKVEDTIDRISELLRQSPRTPACTPRLSLVRDIRPSKAHPEEQGNKIRVDFAESGYAVPDAACTAEYVDASAGHVMNHEPAV
jgi:hypothetical protein